MSSGRQSKTIFLLSVVLLFIFFHFVGFLRPLENITIRLFSYPLSVFYSSASRMSFTFGNFYKCKDLVEQSNQWQKKIISLETRIIELEQILNQKEILDKERKFLEEKNLTSVPAKVIARGIDGNQNLLIINKGAADGLYTGLAVIIEDGLVVGRLVEVADHVAHVLLLTDSKSQVSAASLDNGTLLGIVQGSLGVGLKLKFVPKERELKKGDLIITSGEEEAVPEGLLIGEIVEVNNDERDLFKTASVWRPEAIKKTNLVSVVIP